MTAVFDDKKVTRNQIHWLQKHREVTHSRSTNLFQKVPKARLFAHRIARAKKINGSTRW
jgi:hypothetical protein